MNFFRKKGRVIFNFAPGEIQEANPGLEKSLAEVFPLEADTRVSLDIREAKEVNLEVLRKLLSFAREAGKAGSRVELIATAEIADSLEELEMTGFFHQVEVKN